MAFYPLTVFSELRSDPVDLLPLELALDLLVLMGNLLPDSLRVFLESLDF